MAEADVCISILQGPRTDDISCYPTDFSTNASVRIDLSLYYFRGLTSIRTNYQMETTPTNAEARV